MILLQCALDSIDLAADPTDSGQKFFLVLDNVSHADEYDTPVGYMKQGAPWSAASLARPTRSEVWRAASLPSAPSLQRDQ